jgi:hypothetical protein
MVVEALLEVTLEIREAELSATRLSSSPSRQSPTKKRNDSYT